MNKTVIIIIAAVVLLAGGGGAAFFMMGGEEPADNVQPIVEEADPIFVELRPDFVVNYQHQGSIRYVQASIEVMHTDQDIIDALTLRLPMIRNNLIMILSEQTFADLQSRDAKENLRALISAEIGKILGGDEGIDPPVEVFITKFIMQ